MRSLLRVGLIVFVFVVGALTVPPSAVEARYPRPVGGTSCQNFEDSRVTNVPNYGPTCGYQGSGCRECADMDGRYCVETWIRGSAGNGDNEWCGIY